MILHMIEKEEWLKIKDLDQYTPPSLKTEGFIHCSTSEQVIEIANLFYKGHTNLLLLCIDPNKLVSKLVFEDLISSGKLFPHIYGPLNLDAVSSVVEFPIGSNGVFERLPSELIEL